MKHIAAYALLVLGGKASPSPKDVEKVLKDAGVAAESDKIEALCKALEGKEFHELVETGTKTLGSMGTGSGAAAATGGAAAAKEEAAPVEEEPEEDVDMGDLFGGGDDDY